MHDKLFKPCDAIKPLANDKFFKPYDAIKLLGNEKGRCSKENTYVSVELSGIAVVNLMSFPVER